MKKLTIIIGVSCTVFPVVSVPPPVRVKTFCAVVCVLSMWRSSVSLLSFLKIKAFGLNCKDFPLLIFMSLEFRFQWMCKIIPSLPLFPSDILSSNVSMAQAWCCKYGTYILTYQIRETSV